MFLKKLVKALEKHQVRYTLVGGYAVALHGAPRFTMDIDFLTVLSEKNLKNAEAALQSIGLQSRLPISAQDVAHFREEYIQNRNLIAWSFVNPKDPMEAVDILLTHELSEMDSVTKKIEDISVSVISLEGLIQLKKEAGREQDLEDIRALKGLKK
jgi:predicted nucleotidyltransferase